MTDDLPTITMSNNRNEMLAAFHEMKRLLTAKEQEVLTAQQERGYAQVQEIASKAVDSARHVVPAPAAPVGGAGGEPGR